MSSLHDGQQLSSAETPNVFCHFEDILTTMAELKSEGDSQLERDLPHKTNGSIRFYKPGDRVESLYFMISIVIGLNHYIL